MSTRSAALADRFDRAVDDFARAIDAASDAHWAASGGPEGWTVAATAQHVAGQFPLEREFIDEAATGGAGTELHVGRHQRQERHARGCEHAVQQGRGVGAAA